MLAIPERAIGKPAVDQDDSRIRRAGYRVRYGNAVNGTRSSMEHVSLLFVIVNCAVYGQTARWGDRGGGCAGGGVSRGFVFVFWGASATVRQYWSRLRWGRGGGRIWNFARFGTS